MKICKHCGAPIYKFQNPDGWATGVSGVRERDYGCPVKNRHEPKKEK